MFDSSTPTSSSSSTLVTTTTTTTTDSTSTSSTSIQSFIATHATDSKPKPKLSLNTSATRPGASSSSDSPKMSDKGFIQPHASHLPRRIKGPNNNKRTKTASVPTSQEELDLRQQQQQQQQLDQLREQLQLYQLESSSSTSVTQPNNNVNVMVHPDPPNPLLPIQPVNPSQVSTYPHRDNLPRRTRVHERSKTTTPMNPQIRARRPPIPQRISIVDSQSTIEAETTTDHRPPPLEVDQEPETLNPPPFKFNSKALSLISKAQNKAFKSQIVNNNDDDGPTLEDPNHALDSRRLSSPMSTSPQLPHPAMGLTMGIMEAYATEEESEMELDNPTKQPPAAAGTLFRSGLSYSPALGVKGTPPPPLQPRSAVFPVGLTRFVPVPASAPVLIPRIEITNATPVLGVVPPVSAPLGQNLPRRHHRYRRKGPPPPEVGEGDGDGGERMEKEVLRFERVRPSVIKRNRVEGNEEEDGLFSSLLDFERAGSGGVGPTIERQAGDSPSVPSGPRGRRKGGDERCIQVLGESCVEVGYMRESEAKGKADHVLVEAIGDGDQRRLELFLPDDAAVCREGVPSLLSGQVKTGCEFMKGLGETRIRISVPQWRAQDALGLAVCFLVWAEPQEHVSLKVNDVVCLESYSPIHQLYMRLLDDGDGGGEEGQEWDVSGKGKGAVVNEEVGLGLIGVDLGPRAEEAEGEQSAHSTSTTGSSRPTLVRRGRGYHVREAALGGLGVESRRSPSSSSSSSPHPSEEWTGLRDEWRGVLSYEGLNSLVGLWP